MTGVGAPPAEAPPDQEWLAVELRRLAGERAERLNRQAPLSACGLDSLELLELLALTERRLGISLSDPDSLGALTLDTLLGPGAAQACMPGDQEMGKDTVLPSEIRPRGSPFPGPPRRVLLTGATGFLGSRLLDELLDTTPAEVWCLVRRPIARPGRDARVRVLDGDLSQAFLGMTPSRFRELSDSVDAVYHVGATVNWCYPYALLRQVHVRGTLDLIRLAAGGEMPSRFHFVSTQAVCFPSGALRRIDAGTDPASHLEDLELGYAQAKAVAETLVRQAAARGLETTIVRPPLITGDSRSGAGNSRDLLTTLLGGCIRMGAAPDLDWTLDACPVDEVASAIVAFGKRAGPRLGALHLGNSHHRRWRECVLWLNLYGYRIELVPYRDWLAKIQRGEPGAEFLCPLLPFLARRIRDVPSRYLPELFSSERQSFVPIDETVPTPLDATLFERCLDAFVRQEVFPRPKRPRPRRRRLGEHACLRLLWGDPGCNTPAAPFRHVLNGDSLMGEIASWLHGPEVGLHRWRVRLDGVWQDVAVKVRPAGEFPREVGLKIARTCSKAMGEAFEEHAAALGLCGTTRREIAIASMAAPELCRHMPRFFGAAVAFRERRSILVTEFLSGVRLMNSAAQPGAWKDADIRVALRGAARFHSAWYGREADLTGQRWLGAVSVKGAVVAAAALWEAMDAEAARSGGEAAREIAPIRRRLLADLGGWWAEYERLPRTLIHNDFNPRNAGLRSGAGGYRLVAWDWELATLAPPQRDVAEFLCFVLPRDVSSARTRDLLAAHQRAMEAALGTRVPEELSTLAFRLALYDFGINRLALYQVIHRFRPLPFLPGLLGTWKRLYEHFPHV